MFCNFHRTLRFALLLLTAAVMVLYAAAEDAPAAVIGIIPAEGAGDLTVQEVAPGTPAESAGIRRGDKLLAVNGQPLADTTALRRVLRGLRAGEPAELRLKRGSQLLVCTLVPALRATALPRPPEPNAQLQRLRPLKEDVRAALAALPQQGAQERMRHALHAMQELAEQTAAVRGTGVLRLADAQGYLELREEAGDLVLTACNKSGEPQATHRLNSPQDARALPPELLNRCHSLVSVEHYSRAERSGIRPADTVVSINGSEVPDEETLNRLLDTAPDGALVEVYRIDHTEVLQLAARNYKAPRRELKVDWEAEEEREERQQTAFNALLWELARPHPSPAAALRAWRQLNPQGCLLLADARGTLCLYSERGQLYIKDLGGIYRADMPLPQSLRNRLLHLRR